MTCAIYKITEKETGRCYVGQTRDVKGRWKRHSKKYPLDKFSYEILMECDAEQADFWEIAWITSERSAEFGFNKTVGGQHWDMVFSDETIRKISEANKRMVFSDEHRRKLAEAATGKQYLLGRKHSEETKRKQSEGLKAYWAARRAAREN